MGTLDLQSSRNVHSGIGSAGTWSSSRLRNSERPRVASFAPENGKKLTIVYGVEY